MIRRTLLLLALFFGLTALANCQEETKNPSEAKPGKKKRAEQVQVLDQLEKKIEAAEPTEEQKAKIKALSDEYKPKFLELAKKYNEAISAETRKQIASARKELAATGKKGKELAAALAEQVPLSEEQKKVSHETNTQKTKLQSEFISKLSEILTPEQIAKAGIKTPKAKKAA
jgi:hypothetical protein